MSTGIRNPRRQVKICIAGIALGATALLAGVLAMDGPDGPVWAHAATGIGLLLCIVFPLFLFNFLWAVRLTTALQRGENVIARWTVPQQTLEEFRTNEERLKQAGRANDYKLPRKIPAQGLEVIFSPSAVMIGDTFFGLAKSGMARFTSIQMVPGNPLAIGFGLALTTGRATSTGATLTTIRSELRIPVARGASAEASKVLSHYTSVDRGHTIARPGFWQFRIKLGLWAAAIAAAVGATGFLLNAMKVQGEVPLILAVAGTVTALGGLVLAGLAALMQRGEKEDRGR